MRSSRRIILLSGLNKTPTYLFSEIGNINSTTVVARFSIPILASNYADGFTIKRAGVSQVITGAVRQVDLHTVYFSISAPVLNGEAITIEYTKVSGTYTNLRGTRLLESFSATSVQNNIRGAGFAMGVLGLTYSA